MVPYLIGVASKDLTNLCKVKRYSYYFRLCLLDHLSDVSPWKGQTTESGRFWNIRNGSRVSWRDRILFDGPFLFAEAVYFRNEPLEAEIDGNAADRPSQLVNKYNTTGIPKTERYPVKNQVSARLGRSGGFSNMISPSGRPFGNVPADPWCRNDMSLEIKPSISARFVIGYHDAYRERHLHSINLITLK